MAGHNGSMIELPGPLVDAAWLAAHLDEVYVADVRWYLDGRSGRDAHAAGHIPGAVWVDVDADLAGPKTPTSGRHPLPDPDALAVALARLGIGEDGPVVAYDDASGSIAARLWWMLDAIGQPAAVLDGGLPAWTGPLETADAAAPAGAPAGATTRTSRPWPTAAIVDADQVDRLRRDPAAVVIDARAPERYMGQVEPIDARPGHIPGARNHPWADNIGPDGRFRPPAELRHRFAHDGIGTRPGGGSGRAAAALSVTVVASCGSGVTACHDLLALRVAGLGGGHLFPGSWSAWAADPERPAATGPEPG
jgi:thiosulfate/3-mercaptopyruvate sulfurtransferase